MYQNIARRKLECAVGRGIVCIRDANKACFPEDGILGLFVSHCDGSASQLELLILKPTMTMTVDAI